MQNITLRSLRRRRRLSREVKEVEKAVEEAVAVVKYT